MRRECGDCTLCCKLLPVPTLKKLAGQRCDHQRLHGCAIYQKPEMPSACRLWHCRWLINDEARDLPRPDRAHYVIDMLPDQLRVSDADTGFEQNLVCIQIWVDPDYREQVINDRKLRAWIYSKAEQGFPTLLRFGSREAVGVFAPPLASDDQWHFKGGEINADVGLWK